MKKSARTGLRRPKLGVWGFLVLGLAAVLAFLTSLCLGSVSLTPLEVLKALGAELFGLAGADPISVTIVWQLRLARSLQELCCRDCFGIPWQIPIPWACRRERR